MPDKRNVKANIWVYAVVLFTSAFIVLLITAYSQIKLNRNIVDFKNQISSQKSEKNKYQLNFENAQEINNKLSEENAKLNTDNKTLSATIEKQNNDMKTAEDQAARKIIQYESLSQAQAEYLKGNTVICAQTLKNIEQPMLDEKAKEAFELLSKKVYGEAGKELYEEGYKLYNRGDYAAAAEKLSMSREFSENEDYSDNCLYYMAYALQKSGNTLKAIDNMNLLINEYPSSTFIKSAKKFIQKYGGIKP